MARKTNKVSVHIVKSAPLAVTTELPGRTDAFRVAEVRPQVSGIILRRNFTEGSDVKAGDSLYQIDPATYQAAYDSAKGELAKAQAAANIAHLTVKRYLPLVGTQYVSKQEYDQAVATAQQADASVIAAKAGVESARINLAYTKVTSPVDGRIGKSSVTEGALVTNGQASALATVQQLDPIYVDVTQSSNEFMRLKQTSLQKGDTASSVELLMENGQPYPLKERCSSQTSRWMKAPVRLPCAPFSLTLNTFCYPGCSFAPALMKAHSRMQF